MKSRLVNPLIPIVTMLLTFCALELAVRIFKQEFSFKNYLVEHINLFRSAYPVEHDAELGWIPKPGASGAENVWGTEVTIREHGVRSNGATAMRNPALGDSAPILAIGDSFTFGDEVSDHETWPAQLESLLHRKVINAGVFGYGLDQSFLRAKKLLPIYKPGIVIFSFIVDDIYRCELSQRTGVSKPYFAVVEDSLWLQNTPVPPPALLDLGLGRKVFGYSLFVHKVMLRAFPDYWMHGLWVETRAHRGGEQVACLLMSRLQEIARLAAADVLVLVQYSADESDENLQLARRIIRCMDNAAIRVVDLRPALDQMRAHDPEKYADIFNFLHMTNKGNYFIAELLRQVIDGRH